MCMYIYIYILYYVCVYILYYLCVYNIYNVLIYICVYISSYIHPVLAVQILCSTSTIKNRLNPAGLDRRPSLRPGQGQS